MNNDSAVALKNAIDNVKGDYVILNDFQGNVGTYGVGFEHGDAVANAGGLNNYNVTINNGSITVCCHCSQCRIRSILSIASTVSEIRPKAVSRTNPSPHDPNPTPGVVIIPH